MQQNFRAIRQEARNVANATKDPHVKQLAEAVEALAGMCHGVEQVAEQAHDKASQPARTV